MAQSLPARHDGGRPRWRSAITTVLMLLLAVMIVRDICARRWGSVQPLSSDVARRAP